MGYHDERHKAETAATMERRRERLIYAFDHLVSGHARPEDAHAADSLDHGREVLVSLNLPSETIDIVEDLAFHVAGDYAYTGEATELVRRINAGQI